MTKHTKAAEVVSSGLLNNHGAPIRTEQVSRWFQRGPHQVRAVTEVSLEIPRGRLVVVRGRSGAGKTTLLNLLLGLDSPSSGQVFWGERDVATLSPDDVLSVRRHDLAVVFADFGLLDALTAAENVGVALRLLKTSVAEREQRVAQALHEVGLSEHSQQRPDELSGGQQQRVAVARALVAGAQVLIADEPTGQLDSENAAAVMSLIRRAVDERAMTAVVSTHDPDVAGFADVVLHLRDGRLTHAS